MNIQKELEKLRDSNKNCFDLDGMHGDICFYGAGNLGVLGAQILKRIGGRVKYIVDANKNGIIEGIPIINPSDILQEDKKETLFLICISTISYTEICSYLTEKLGINNVMHFYTYAYLNNPGILSNGWVLEDKEYMLEKALKICKCLSHDEFSIAHYISFLYWKRFNDEHIFEDYPVCSKQKYFSCDIFPPLEEDEFFLDIGCYEGANIEMFVSATNRCFKGVLGIEPVEPFIEVARANNRDERIRFIKCAISNYEGEAKFEDRIGMAAHFSEQGLSTVEVKSIDNLNVCPSIVKVHVEGAEYDCLIGGINSICNNRPIIMVTADHNKDGWYVIPSFIERLKGYKLYFRLHDYCGNSAVWYFIPLERDIRCVQ